MVLASIARSPEFEAVVAISIRFEGGFVDDPADPGGATNWGITLEGLSEWRKQSCTASDVRALARDEAEAIYLERYWTPMGCAGLPVGLDLVVFDFGINAGPGRSVPMLQRMVGQKPDGANGPKTIAAAQCSGVVLLTRIAMLSKSHEAYYHTLPEFGRFGRGWSARVDACETAARGLAGGVPASVQPALPKPRVAISWEPLPDPATDDLNAASVAGTLTLTDGAIS